MNFLPESAGFLLEPTQSREFGLLTPFPQVFSPADTGGTSCKVLGLWVESMSSGYIARIQLDFPLKWGGIFVVWRVLD